jgi:hypothetical protein
VSPPTRNKIGGARCDDGGANRTGESQFPRLCSPRSDGQRLHGSCETTESRRCRNVRHRGRRRLICGGADAGQTVAEKDGASAGPTQRRRINCDGPHVAWLTPPPVCAVKSVLRHDAWRAPTTRFCNALMDRSRGSPFRPIPRPTPPLAPRCVPQDRHLVPLEHVDYRLPSQEAESPRFSDPVGRQVINIFGKDVIRIFGIRNAVLQI